MKPLDGIIIFTVIFITILAIWSYNFLTRPPVEHGEWVKIRVVTCTIFRKYLYVGAVGYGNIFDRTFKWKSMRILDIKKIEPYNPIWFEGSEWYELELEVKCLKQGNIWVYAKDPLILGEEFILKTKDVYIPCRIVRIE